MSEAPVSDAIFRRSAASTPEVEAVAIFDGAGDVMFASAGLATLLGRPIVNRRELEAVAADMPWLTIRAVDLPPGADLPIGVVELRRAPVDADGSGAVDGLKSREALTRILAHELRTPMTSVYGGAQLMADPAISAETRHRAAETVATEAERLYRTVEDLLVLARFDEPLDIGDVPVLLQRFVPELVAAEAQRVPSLRFEATIPADLPAVAGRQGYVEQILRNLLEVVVRSSPAGGRIRVTASPGPGPDKVAVQVQDEGPAIGAHEADVLFDLFADTPRAARGASGANLSLAVARRLVEAMGGSLEAIAGGPARLVFTMRIVPDES